ncbi:MAG: ATP-binding cassette domain-containing protein [Bacilli bacterium]
MEPILQVNHIRKTFSISKKQQVINRNKEKLKVAVDDLSFNAYDGEIYGLLGSNGAGKTTTLRMIATLITPEQGNITICGWDVKKDANEIRKCVGFLTSELKLEEFFTPSYLYDFYSDLHQIPKETQIIRKEFLFNKFGIRKFEEVKVGELSTGMRQKASLAISMAHDPHVIVFDEPTNGLDVLTAKVVTDFLLDLKKQGKCIIVSTHIFSLIEKVCDRVGIIIDGKMVRDLPMIEMCQNKSLEDVFFELYASKVGEVE